MTFWLADFHTTQVLCGMPSEAGLRAAFQALCASDESATSCDLVATIDPEGNEKVIEGVSFPGGAPQPVDQETPGDPGTEEPGEAGPDSPDPAGDQQSGAEADPEAGG